MKRFFAIILSALMILSLMSVAALADTSGSGAGKASQRSPQRETINYGSAYDHIEVKTDAVYGFSIDGVAGTMSGKVVPSSITVKIGSRSYTGFSQTAQQEGSHHEYSRRMSWTSPASLGLTWIPGTWQPSNVTVSLKIVFAANVVPAELKPHLTREADGSYSVMLTDYPYAGIQECTGGNGMRSEGNSGTPTGLDLYINASGLNVLTKGKLGIAKLVVNEDGNALPNNTAEFEYTITRNGSPVYFVNNVYTADPNAEGAVSVLTVRNGQQLSLTGLPAGTYTVTETQKDGYIIRDIDGQAGAANYSKDYVVTVKNDNNIPIANFTNTMLTSKTGVSLNKTASGLPNGSRYPNPTVSIYATDANGNKTGSPIFTGTLDANGDTLYLTALFSPGVYIVEETGADVTGYDLDTTLLAGGLAQNGMSFIVTENDKGRRISLTVNNVYSEQPEPHTQTGSLKIIKRLAGDVSVNKEGQLIANDGTVIINSPSFSFTLYKDNVPVNDSIASVFVPATATEAASWVATVDNLAPGSYTIEEHYAELFNYDLTVSYDPDGGAVTIAEENETVSINVTNNYTKQQQLTLSHNIEKFVTADMSLNLPAGNRTFYFTVGIAAPRPEAKSPPKTRSLYTTAPFDVSFTGDFKQSDDPSKGDFMVTINGAGHASGAIVIKGTPDEFEMLKEADAKFVIKENDSGIQPDWNYDTNKTYSIHAGYSHDTNTVEHFILLNDEEFPAENAIKFVNTYKNNDTGTLVVTKKLSGDDVNPNDEFNLELKLNQPTGSTPLLLNYVKFDAEGNIIGRGELVSAFTLKGGEVIMITGIRLGVTYTVTETNPKGYTVTYTNRTGILTANDPTASVTVTNTRNKTFEKVTYVTVTKVWDDNNNKDKLRPSSVYVWLLRNGVPYSKVELHAGNRWTFTWENLDAKQRWSIDESDVPAGYRVFVKTLDGHNFTVTNYRYNKPNVGTGDSIHPLVPGALLAAAGLSAAVILGKKRRKSSK